LPLHAHASLECNHGACLFVHTVSNSNESHATTEASLLISYRISLSLSLSLSLFLCTLLLSFPLSYFRHLSSSTVRTDRGGKEERETGGESRDDQPNSTTRFTECTRHKLTRETAGENQTNKMFFTIMQSRKKIAVLLPGHSGTMRGKKCPTPKTFFED